MVSFDRILSNLKAVSAKPRPDGADSDSSSSSSSEEEEEKKEAPSKKGKGGKRKAEQGAKAKQQPAKKAAAEKVGGSVCMWAEVRGQCRARASPMQPITASMHDVLPTAAFMPT